MDSLNLNSRFVWAVSLIEKYANENDKDDLIVFDVGTENQQLIKYCADQKITVKSFDIQPKNNTIIKWDVEDSCPTQEKADIIIFLEVVEHLNNPILALKNLKAALKPRGLFILSTPNPEWSRSKFEFLFLGELNMFKEHDLKINHHVYPALSTILEFQLTQVGFKDITYQTLGSKTKLFDRNLLTKKLPFQIVLRVVCKIIEYFNSRSIGGIYGINCRNDI